MSFTYLRRKYGRISTKNIPKNYAESDCQSIHKNGTKTYSGFIVPAVYKIEKRKVAHKFCTWVGMYMGLCTVLYPIMYDISMKIFKNLFGYIEDSLRKILQCTCF
jgi:hypothetical protein